LEINSEWDDSSFDLPIIVLSKPILISKNSNPKLLSEYLNLRIFTAFSCFFINNDVQLNQDLIIHPLNHNFGVYIKYKEIDLF
jgi:uncharacterized protein (DUF486 family)